MTKFIENDEIFEKIKTLSTKDILIIYLKNAYEMSNEEIGKRVSLSRESIRKKIIKIYKKIKNGIS